MKHKKTILFSIIILLLFIIYQVSVDRKVYYISLGDAMITGKTEGKEASQGFNENVVKNLEEKKMLEFYTNNFSNNDFRTTDLYNMIKANTTTTINNHDLSIKNALIKADLVTLSIGLNDILYKIDSPQNNTSIYAYLDEVVMDIDDLIAYIRKYCKEDIVYIGIYNPLDSSKDEYFSYVNNYLSQIMEKYNVYYIDTFNMFKHHQKSTYKYLSATEYNHISLLINEFVNNTILK